MEKSLDKNQNIQSLSTLTQNRKTENMYILADFFLLWSTSQIIGSWVQNNQVWV